MGTVRFLLALCVVVTHSAGSKILGVSLFSGITAVQCFYVISGFLITMILNERAEYQILGNFYVSRYLRLWPTYIFVAALTLILFYQDRMFRQLPTLSEWPGIAFIAFSNLTLFFQDWFLFFRFDGGQLVPTSAFGTWPGPQLASFLLVPPCWSIGVELTFYAIAPFVCRRWWSVAALFAFGTIVRLVVASFNPAHDPWIYRFAPSEMMLFGSGGLAYFIGREIYPRFPFATKIACAFFMASIAAITLGSEVVTPWIGRYFGWLESHLLLMWWPVLLLMAVAAPALFYGTRNSKSDQFLGELSYPMYVSHMLVSSLLAKYAPPQIQDGNLLYVACVLVVSLALVFAIIKPMDKIRRRTGDTELSALLGDTTPAAAAAR